MAEKKHKPSLRCEALAAIFFGGFFIVLVNLFWWRLPFIKSDFGLILPWINLSAFAALVFNMILLLMPIRIIKLMSTIVSFGFIIFIGTYFLVVFPFDFRFNVLELCFRCLFTLTIIGGGIAVITESVKTMRNPL